MKKTTYLSLITLLAINASANDLGTINVTTAGLGQEQSIEDVHASVEVISEKQIQQTSAKSLPQVLNEVAGLNIKDGGSSSNISIRGFDDSHTLILVDGMRITGKYGSSDLTSIQLQNVERVEVIKGPMSALYGADALAGVVNIITKKKATEDSVKGTILGGVAQNGERDTGIIRLHATKAGKNITHNISLEVREKDEYREDSQAIATDLRNESRKFISYSNYIDLGDNDSISMKLDYAKQDDDGTNEGFNRTTSTTYPYATYEKEDRYHAALQHKHTAETYLIDTNLGYSNSDTKVNRSGTEETTDYKQYEINSYLRHFTTDKMTNIFGIGYRNEKIDVSIYTQDAKRTNYNLLFQNDYEITNNLTSSIGFRYDDFSDFGDNVSPKASLMYKYSDFKFRASYGEAFKAPGFTDMFSHFTRGTYDISGNPNLKPEESKTFEYTVGYVKDNFTFDITHHRSKLDNLIKSVTDRIVGPIEYRVNQNIDKSQINGTEISLGYQTDYGLGLDVSWEHLDAKDESTGKRLENTAKITTKAKLSYEKDDLGLFFTVKKYNDFYGSDGIRVRGVVGTEIVDYTVTDVKMNYQLTDSVELFFGVDNIQNRIMSYSMRLFGTPNDPGERYYYTGVNFSL